MQHALSGRNPNLLHFHPQQKQKNPAPDETFKDSELQLKREHVAGIDRGASHPFRGVVLFVIALMIFAGMDTTIKYLATRYNVPMVVAIRYIVHCSLMIVFLAPSHGRRLFQTQRTGLVIVRAASLAISSLFVGLALQRIPVAEMTAITFLAPMLVVLLARPILGEQIGSLGWIATMMGFAGVLLIARPGGGLDATGVIYTICAVGTATIYQMLSRILVTTEQTISLLFYTALIGAIGFGIFLPWTSTGASPTYFEMLLFLTAGVTAALGHFFFTAAYRHAPASMLAPMNYLQLLWAGLLGWMVFGHVPDHLSIVGMCIVAASGVMIAFKARKTTSLLSSTDLEP